jgi:hypothetical protein
LTPVVPRSRPPKPQNIPASTVVTIPASRPGACQCAARRCRRGCRLWHRRSRSVLDGAEHGAMLTPTGMPSPPAPSWRLPPRQKCLIIGGESP